MAMEKHFIQEGIIRSKIEHYLRDELNRAGYSSVNIQKTPLSTRIILYVEKPPLVIGKKGTRIKNLTRYLNENYGLENPTVDVQKIEVPILDPNIVARRIAVALERGMNRRRVVYRALRSVMQAQARGVEIVLSGKLVGKGGRSRVEKYNQGYMKKAGDSAKLVNAGNTQAYLKAGIIGVTVKIVPPGAVFPDQILIAEPEAEKEPESKKAKGEGADGEPDAAGGDKKPKKGKAAKKAKKAAKKKVKAKKKEAAKKEDVVEKASKQEAEGKASREGAGLKAPKDADKEKSKDAPKEKEPSKSEGKAVKPDGLEKPAAQKPVGEALNTNANNIKPSKDE